MLVAAVTTVADTSAWIAAHIPSRYDEHLAGTSNVFTVRVTPDGCRIRMDVDSSNDFNQFRNSDRSKVFAVKGNPKAGLHFDASFGSGTLDFTKIDPQSLRIDQIDEYVASEEVRPDSFELPFLKESDARQMLDEMTSLIPACQPAP
jgi:hypothetical protein